MRSFCRFVAFLPILTFIPVLAHAQGTRPSQTLLPSPASISGQINFPVNVRPASPPFTPSPTGTVTLYNGATAIGSPVSLTPGSGVTNATFAATFGTPDPSVASAASGALWGDFNEDGAPDLLVYGTGSGTGGQPGLVVQTFLAKIPAGVPPTYTPVTSQQLALPLSTQAGQTLAVLDVDGDGHLDLLAGNTVAYGKGDGTFGRVAVLPALATGYNQTYAVDIDGDGKTDIVAVDTPPSPQIPGTVQYAFTVFHNAGGGNFMSMGPYPLAPSFTAGSSIFYNIFGLSFADVNGDGRMDVLSQSNAVPFGNAASGNNLNVMLNLGTAFGAPKAVDTSTVPNLGFASTVFTDLNDDGKQDLVFSYQSANSNNGVATLLGNGDGTFAASMNFDVAGANAPGSGLLPLITEDVNADGKADVVLGSGVLLLGDGTGTLTTGTPLFTSTVAPGNAPPAYALPGQSIPLGDNDVGGQIIFINLQPGANAVFTPNLGSYATPTALLAPGTYSLTAHYSGDASYGASISNTINLTVPPSAPTITVTSSANPIYASQSVTFTATLSDPTITGTITFFYSSNNDDNPLDPMTGSTFGQLGTGTIADGVATLTTKLPVGGANTIYAYYGPESSPIAQGQLTETVNVPFAVLVSSTGISLTASPGQTVTATLPVQGLGGYTGQVNFSCRPQSDPAPSTCSFSPATVDVAGTGTSTVTLTVTALRAPTLAKASPGFSETILACSVPLFALFGIASAGRRRALFAVIAIALCGISSLGCGGGGGQKTPANSLPPGSYVFYIIAGSGPNTLVIGGTLKVN